MSKKIEKMLARKSIYDPPELCLSTGCITLDLAIANRKKSIPQGSYVFFCGGSDTGKTFLAWTMLAEALNDPKFKDYSFIHDDTESGSLMNKTKFYGERIKQVQAPRYDKNGNPLCSEDLEDFYFNAYEHMRSKPCFYVLDSMDALSSSKEREAFDTNLKTKRKAQELNKDADYKSTFGDGKAKGNSQGLRQLMSVLSKNGSILLVISQAKKRIKTNPFDFGKDETFSGGTALKFYAHIQIWTSYIKKITKTKKGIKRDVGSLVRFHIEKNRIEGQKRTIEVPIYYDYGMDSIGAGISFMLDNGLWKKSKSSIIVPEFEFKGTEEKLIEMIEKENLEKDFNALIEGEWRSMQRMFSSKRKRKYL